jgi:lambda repressor-like predicted transcriptional regulator
MKNSEISRPSHQLAISDELRAKIIRVSKQGISTQNLALRFGYSQRTICYVLQEAATKSVEVSS